MVEIFDIAPENPCDICGRPSEGSINGNQLCETHLTEYRNRHFNH